LGGPDDVLVVRGRLLHEHSAESELGRLGSVELDPVGLRADPRADPIRFLDTGTNSMIGLIILIVLVLLLIGALPQTGLHEGGYGPGIGIGGILLIVLILYLLGVFR
jgi:hypothetical protein